MYSVITPAVVIRPILSGVSVNFNAPSAPAVMATGTLVAGSAYSVMTPAVVIFPMARTAVNHKAPSGPVVMLPGKLLPAGPGGKTYSVKAPAVVIRPILLAPYSVNHSAPSGPEVMARGMLFAVGTAYTVKVGVCAHSDGSVDEMAAVQRRIQALFFFVWFDLSNGSPLLR